MRRSAFLLAFLLGAPGAGAQVTLVAPGSNQGQPAKPSETNYGPPRVIELDALSIMPESYQRTHVIVDGDISETGVKAQWVLHQGGASILLIPGKEFDSGRLLEAAGRRVEIRGIVRMIRPKQYVGRPPVDLDLVEDPLLPVLPPPSVELPRVSITVLAIRDKEGPERVRPDEMGGGVVLRILEEPAAYLNKNTRIIGQFRGRNLFGDLPANSKRGKEDWVLKEGDTAIWVTGRPPKGEGWKLDLDYKGDSKTWLEVEGKAEVVNGVVYLKASRVLPAKASGYESRGPSRR
jgi:hypothetical protein